MIKTESRWERKRVEVVADFDIPLNHIEVRNENNIGFHIDARHETPEGTICLTTMYKGTGYSSFVTIEQIHDALDALHKKAT